LINWAAS